MIQNFFLTQNFFGTQIFSNPNFCKPKFFWTQSFFRTNIFFWPKRIFWLIFFRPKTMFGGRKQSFGTLSFLNWQMAKVLLKLEFDTEDQVLSPNISNIYFHFICVLQTLYITGYIYVWYLGPFAPIVCLVISNDMFRVMTSIMY